jgi:hypothetical protein
MHRPIRATEGRGFGRDSGQVLDRFFIFSLATGAEILPSLNLRKT